MSPDDPRHGSRPGYVNGGCRCRPCTDAHAREHNLYRLGRRPRLIDSTGTRRRVEALLAIGWTRLEISEACGRTTRAWSDYLIRSESRVRSDVAASVVAAYARMADHEPGGRLRARGRLIAARAGYAPPGAWLDIDDPDETPDPGWRERAARDRDAGEVAEEWEHLRYCGVSIEQAAEQLGVTIDAIQTAVRRAERRVA